MEEMRKVLLAAYEDGLERGGTFTHRPIAEDHRHMEHEPGVNATPTAIELRIRPLGRGEFSVWDWHSHPSGMSFSMGKESRGDITRNWMSSELAQDKFVLGVPNVKIWRANRRCKEQAYECAREGWYDRVDAWQVMINATTTTPIGIRNAPEQSVEALRKALDGCGVCIYEYVGSPEFDGEPPYRMELVVGDSK